MLGIISYIENSRIYGLFNNMIIKGVEVYAPSTNLSFSQ